MQLNVFVAAQVKITVVDNNTNNTNAGDNEKVISTGNGSSISLVTKSKNIRGQITDSASGHFDGNISEMFERAFFGGQ